jgi:hydroxyacylglutathione hydrolase
MMADNYAWIMHDGHNAAVVDPGDAEPVLLFLRRTGLTLSHILVTHHHDDHCGGGEELKRAYGCPIMGPHDFRLPFVDDAVGDGDIRSILSERLEITATPGHTRSHIIFHAPNLRALFTGDTLLCGGCGRIFEGTAADMLQSLIKCVGFEDLTSVYCGHEYTEENLLFATTVEPDNKNVWHRLADVKFLQRRNMPTVPSTIALEGAVNPFLRTGSVNIRKTLKMEKASGIDVFAELRGRKDRF